MRYLLSLLFIFSLNVFATCSTNQKQVTNYVSTCNAVVGKFYFGPSDFGSSTRYGYTNELITGINYESPKAGGGYYCGITYTVVPHNTTGCVYNTSTCTCEMPTCAWATTPPYVQTNLNQSQCSNANKVGYTMDTTYTWNFSWCAVENTCYGLEYSCPVGQIFDSTTSSCRAPKEPFNPSCGTCGYYKVSGSVESPQIGKTCFVDYVCKCNSNIRIRTDVSCSSGPVSDAPVTNPDAPNSPYEGDPTSAAPNTKDHSAMCGTEKMMAQASCVSPKILSFSCDPLTGTVTKSECKDPTTPATTPINSGDDTKAATTQDIKDLGNNLPTSIKDAIKDFFTDGSMPHLESIRGSLEAALTLDSDRNDKLDAISASADASLSLQSDANDHLSGIKTSVDSMKGSLEGGTGIPSSSMISDADILPDGTIGSTVAALSDDLGSIQNQFANAKQLVTGNFTPPTFSGGSCPTLVGPAGISVNPAQIGATLSPYSPIISILVYISIMFITFGSVFKFLSRGLK